MHFNPQLHCWHVCQRFTVVHLTWGTWKYNNRVNFPIPQKQREPRLEQEPETAGVKTRNSLDIQLRLHPGHPHLAHPPMCARLFLILLTHVACDGLNTAQRRIGQDIRSTATRWFGGICPRRRAMSKRIKDNSHIEQTLQSLIWLNT